ncbi:helix-turn-helix transcriptional regulator [Streptomyces sp. NPDC006743]|uniref:helix-turn-helix domain-containing protein n=1 Tax=Streptomyces sp. NPDC006743 TaxID=3154480 RepID=UPI0034517433
MVECAIAWLSGLHRPAPRPGQPVDDFGHCCHLWRAEYHYFREVRITLCDASAAVSVACGAPASTWSSEGQGSRLSGRLAALGGDVEEREFNAAVARLIREARTRAGVTQEYVGRRAGLSRGSITNIESGSQTPPLYRLALIAAAVNVELSDLLPRLQLDEASGLAARHAADVAAVWAHASERMDARGEG